MKTNMIRTILISLLIVVNASCELERLDAATEAAPGGGTLSEFTAYNIDATDPDGSNVFGRVVFWRTSLDQTLVQISLHNTVPGLKHPALILDGAVGSTPVTEIDLNTVSGDTGELSENKFFLISDTAFYDSLPMMDSHLSVYFSESDDTIVATGNIGTNAEPVDSN